MNDLRKINDIARRFKMNITLGECSSATLGGAQERHCNTPTPVKNATLDATASPALAPMWAYTPAWNYSYHGSFNRTYKRTDFLHLIAKWPSSHKSATCPMGVDLQGRHPFSHSFGAAIGGATISNNYGLEDELVLETIFEALLEREATSQFYEKTDNNYIKLVTLTRDEDVQLFVSVEADGKPRWRINYGSTTGTTWTRLISIVFNLSHRDALATLANILNMSFDNLSKLSSDRHTAELNGGSRLIEDVPASLHLPGLPAGSACAELMEKKYIYGNAGQIIGAILRYRLNGNDFCLPATVGHGVLCMGKYKPTAHFLNQHLMDKYQFAKIIFCQDMRTALSLERIFGETRGDSAEKCIVTAHLGDDLSVLPWNYFHGHEVVFIPAPTKECMALVKLYKDYIAGAQAKSFRIYSGFFLHSQPGCDLTGHVEGITDAEEELLHKAVWLDTVERPTWLMEQVVKRGVSYDEFVAWGQKLGIFKKPKEQSKNNEASSCNSLSLFQPRIGLTATPLTNVTDVTTKQIVVPGGITLLHGLKDSGKSITCISAAKAIITGEGLFEVFTAGESRNILYLDSETPQDLLTERLDQFGLLEEIGNRLFLLSKFDLQGNDLAFSIMDQKFRDYVEDIMRAQNCGYLVLDNLTSLMDDGSIYHSTTVSKLFEDWIDNLARQGLGVVMVSHTQEGPSAGTAAAKTRGCEEFSIRAHTEIVLVRGTEILEKKLGTEVVQHKATQDGLTVGICFKVCKVACILQKKTFWLHLPLGASEWELLAATGVDGKEIKVSSEKKETCIEPTLDEGLPPTVMGDLPTQTTKHSLSPDQKKTLGILQKGSAKCKEIQQQLDVCEDKTRDLLKSLIDVGMVTKEGQGKATYYALKSSS
ncbi:AAA family ATPase [Desulfovibrio intestinalis]|uniref:AAA+ ATPase domain-containing protein n=1 Tax=Desulfovibrio intestinalis TaxID=58621 RepID=A0A7W8C595_9BACT|nr:AAA family ATPase [Desulfovibrio intestinalis]MBB5144639.1 hypothetical protein [Desulfovibrio intestinalis]